MPEAAIIETRLGRFRHLAVESSTLGAAPRQFSWEFECPVCKIWGSIDNEQLHGKISVDHSGQRYRDIGGVWRTCTYHETHDFSAALAAASPKTGGGE